MQSETERCVWLCFASCLCWLLMVFFRFRGFVLYRGLFFLLVEVVEEGCLSLFVIEILKKRTYTRSANLNVLHSSGLAKTEETSYCLQQLVHLLQPSSDVLCPSCKTKHVPCSSSVYSLLQSVHPFLIIGGTSGRFGRNWTISVKFLLVFHSLIPVLEWTCSTHIFLGSLWHPRVRSPVYIHPSLFH